MLAMITMRKSTHGFSFASHMGIGLRFAALRAATAPLKNGGYLFSSFGVIWGLCFQDTQNHPIRLPIVVAIFSWYCGRHCPK